MSSMSGYVTYIEYTRSTAKGATTGNELIVSPFQIGDVDVDYTANKVVEAVESGASGKVAWGPVVVKARPDGTLPYRFLDAAGAKVEGGTLSEDGSYTAPSGAAKIAYEYDNVVIPQDKLPAIKAEMKSIPLVAKARRIAVYYSQIAAYQAKTDYGVDLGDQLAEKAVGELAYEIDTEITNMLSENAGVAEGELVWSKTLPVGVSKTEHYEGFVEVLEIAKKKIYDATKKLKNLCLKYCIIY